MVLTEEELEICQFHGEGMSVADISEATGYTRYQLKKLLGYNSYIFRHLKDW